MGGCEVILNKWTNTRDKYYLRDYLRWCTSLYFFFLRRTKRTRKIFSTENSIEIKNKKNLRPSSHVHGQATLSSVRVVYIIAGVIDLTRRNVTFTTVNFNGGEVYPQQSFGELPTRLCASRRVFFPSVHNAHASRTVWSSLASYDRQFASQTRSKDRIFFLNFFFFCSKTLQIVHTLARVYRSGCCRGSGRFPVPRQSGNRYASSAANAFFFFSFSPSNNFFAFSPLGLGQVR